MDDLIRNILKDIRVELSDEFDRNFSREGFFGEKWASRKRPDHRGGRGVLTDTGALRRSIRSVMSGNGITFQSDLPYAAIHNEGGKIRVTARMKRFFWAKMRECEGSIGFTKRGVRRNTKRNRQLSAESAFWKAMALKPVGSFIVIPRRTFIGGGRDVERIVSGIIDENLEGFFKQIDLTKKQ